ncbi:MAG: glycosyltransferase family 2 protein [Candidatus Margulisbacteria bacterium]|nr:glycosyltransferase family 2 protein [Candidatus Margulisiibacteriota bacterium]
MKPKVIVIMPAYNAEKTLAKTVNDLPPGSVDEVILGDDCSSDRTVEIARTLGLTVLKTPRNLGYGGNQKMLYRAALEHGGDVIVMVHPDWQYDATKVPDMVGPIAAGRVDLMMGSRILSGAETMPWYKYISNRFLTGVEELTFGLRLSEYHSGFRAFSRRLLETLPFERNSNDFVFDTEVLAETAAAGFKAGELAVPCRYFAEASEINFWRSTVYGLQTLLVCLKYRLAPRHYKR